MEKIVLLSNTVGRKFKFEVKATAVRRFEKYEIISLLTSDKCNYDDLIINIANYASHIFVDLEKKQPLNINDQFDQRNNLFSSIQDAISRNNLEDKLQIYPIKLNDITVNAVWKDISKDFEKIAGLRLGIVGTGNIGSKLITVLTDSGVKLRCFNRNINKAISVVNSVVLTKPEHVIASPNIVRRFEHTLINTSGLIVSCKDLNEDLSEYLSLLPKNFRVYLIGHSLLKEGSLNKLKNHPVLIKRVDVGKELLMYIIGTLMLRNYELYGNNSNKNVTYCSGGYIGKKGEYIVDNYKDPQWIYGLADGLGGVIYENSEQVKIDNLSKIDDLFN